MSCPRCKTGYIFVDQTDEPRCHQCSYRPPLVPKVIQYRTEGNQCLCGAKGDMTDGSTCKLCRYEGHAEKIRKGMKDHARLCKFVMNDGQPCLVLCPQGNYFYCTEHRARKRTRKIGPMLPVGPMRVQP